jgi:hypothetical protein
VERLGTSIVSSKVVAAPIKNLMQKFGRAADKVIEAAESQIARNSP